MSWSDAYPNLRRVVGPQLEEKAAELEQAFRGDRDSLKRVQKKHSRGFWNTVLSVAYGYGEPFYDAAKFRLDLIERGLDQAERAGKSAKFKAPLTKEDPNFNDVLAELNLLARLGPIASDLDIERLGARPPKNYDLHLVIDGVELHLDSKWRTTTPLGEVGSETVVDLAALLGDGFDATAIATLKTNELLVEQRINLAILVDEARRVAAEPPALSPISIDDWGGLTGQALSLGLHQLTLGVEVESVLVGGRRAAYVRLSNWFAFDDDVLESVEFRAVSGAPRGSCVLIPKAETQATLTKEARREAGVEDGGLPHDVDNPEHQRVTDLISAVSLQLPAEPLNIVALGTDPFIALDEITPALYGEELIGQDGSRKRLGGLFNDSAFDGISGVLVFSVNPPSAFGAKVSQRVRYFPNKACGDQVPEEIVKKLVAELRKEME